MTRTEPPSELPPLPADIDHVSGHELFWLSLAAALLGLITAGGVWLFNHVIAVVRTLSADVHAAGVWTVPLIFVSGGIAIALITHFFGRRDELAAMAHIIDRVAEGSGRLNKRNGLAFVVASALGIGIGAPVGADTPSAMIGAHLAAWVGDRFRQPDLFVRALVVAGAGAGIATTYFAQLAAVFFALEVVLGGFGSAVFVVPTLIAVATAALTLQLTTGAPPQYTISVAGDSWVNATLLLYIGVAILAALASIVYVGLLPRCTAFWARLQAPFWAKTALAGLVIGLAAVWLPELTQGGLNGMRAIFSGMPVPIETLAALVIATLILTPLSLGGGFVGGVVGPALLIGSALGAAYGEVVVTLFPGLGLSPQAFAMVATAAMLAGTLHAPLFGAMMIFEMTNDYRFLLPLLLAAAIGYGMARRFQPGSAYTFMLPRLGLRLKYGTFTIVKQERDRPPDAE